MTLRVFPQNVQLRVMMILTRYNIQNLLNVTSQDVSHCWSTSWFLSNQKAEGHTHCHSVPVYFSSDWFCCNGCEGRSDAVGRSLNRTWNKSADSRIGCSLWKQEIPVRLQTWFRSGSPAVSIRSCGSRRCFPDSSCCPCFSARQAGRLPDSAAHTLRSLLQGAGVLRRLRRDAVGPGEAGPQV